MPLWRLLLDPAMVEVLCQPVMTILCKRLGWEENSDAAHRAPPFDWPLACGAHIGRPAMLSALIPHPHIHCCLLLASIVHPLMQLESFHRFTVLCRREPRIQEVLQQHSKHGSSPFQSIPKQRTVALNLIRVCG